MCLIKKIIFRRPIFAETDQRYEFSRVKTFAVEERWVDRECGDGGGGSCIDGATSTCVKLPLDRGVVAVQDMVSDVSDCKRAPTNLAQGENDFEMCNMKGLSE